MTRRRAAVQHEVAPDFMLSDVRAELGKVSAPLPYEFRDLVESTGMREAMSRVARERAAVPSHEQSNAPIRGPIRNRLAIR